jgi:hypothetical protein
MSAKSAQQLAGLVSIRHAAAQRFEHKLYAFDADLRQRCDRDPRDPEEVSPEEFGRVLKITLATKVRIEDEEIARSSSMATPPPAAEALFRIRTITPLYKARATRTNTLGTCQ